MAGRRQLLPFPVCSMFDLVLTVSSPPFAVMAFGDENVMGDARSSARRTADAGWRPLVGLLLLGTVALLGRTHV